MLDKERIKLQFSRHAAEYDRYAHLQQEIGQELVKRMTGNPSRILDLGCGTGLLALLLAERFPHSQLYAVDIAPGMIEIAQQKALDQGMEQIIFSVDDMEYPHFPEETFDLIVSNASMQWVDHREAMFRRIFSLLAPGGTFLFSTFGKGSLRELRTAARAAFGDHYTHEQTFPDQAALACECEQAGFVVSELKTEVYEKFYDSAGHLLRALKHIGAQNAVVPTSDRIITRREWAALDEQYQKKFGVENKIRVTYEIIFGALVRAD